MDIALVPTSNTTGPGLCNRPCRASVRSTTPRLAPGVRRACHVFS
jgi:hypothetical protein